MPERFDMEDLLSGAVEVIQSPLVPKGTYYLVPRPSLLDYDPQRFRLYESPWDLPRMPERPLLDRLVAPGSATGRTMGEYVDTQRSLALDFLARLLDGWCEETTLHGEPLDPEKVWREPKIREREVRERRRVMVYSGYYGATLNTPLDAFKVTVVP